MHAVNVAGLRLTISKINQVTWLKRKNKVLVHTFIFHFMQTSLKWDALAKGASAELI